MIRTDRALTGVYFVTHDATRAPLPALPQGFAGGAVCAVRSAAGRRSPAAKMFYVSGISQGISTAPRTRCSPRSTSSGGTAGKVAYDTNYRPRLWPPARAAAVMHAAMAGADYAFPGMEDALVLTGLTDPDAILDFYLRAGREGGGAEDGRGRRLSGGRRAAACVSRRMSVQAVDATGAGDTFCGAFLARILAGDAPEPAARYANVAAALKCTGYGAVAPIPRPDEVLRILNG